MNIEEAMANAKEVDFFEDVSPCGKMEAKLLADIAMIIHAQRNALGMTQGQFAKRIGVTQAMVSKLESGEHNLSIKTLAKYFAAMGLDVSLSTAKKNIPIAEIGPSMKESSWKTAATSSHTWGGQFAASANYSASI